MLFFLLINVKMPTIVGILTFLSRKNFMQHEQISITLGLIGMFIPLQCNAADGPDLNSNTSRLA